MPTTTRILLFSLALAAFLLAPSATQPVAQAAPVPPPLLDPDKPDTWEAAVKRQAVELHEATVALITIAGDPDRAAADRRKAVNVLARVGSKESLSFLVASITLTVPKGDESGPAAPATLPCFSELCTTCKGNWLAAKLLVESLEKPREEAELVDVAVALKSILGVNLAILVIEDKVGKGQNDALEKNLAVVLRTLKKTE
jgi:hypothetical protein